MIPHSTNTPSLKVCGGGVYAALASLFAFSTTAFAGVHDFQGLALGPLGGQGAWTYEASGAALAEEDVRVVPGGLYWVGADDGVIPGGTQYLRTRAGLDGNPKMNQFASLAGVERTDATYVRFLVRMDGDRGGSFGSDPYEFFAGFAAGAGFPFSAYVSLKVPAAGDDAIGVETSKVRSDPEETQNSGVLPDPNVALDETLFVVARFNTNPSGEITGIDVWVNPKADDGDAPHHSVVYEEPGAVLSGLNHFNVRAQNMPMVFDNLVIADSWFEVVPPAWDGTPRPPVVLLPPASPEGDLGDTGELSVLVLEDADNPVTGYQWVLNGATNIPAGFGGTSNPFPFQFATAFGATNPVSLAAHNPDVPRTGSNMNVIVSNDVGETSTPQVRIREAQTPEPPVFVEHPESQPVNIGDAAVFSVTVESLLDVTYQWFFDGEPIAGATESTLRVENASELDAGIYTVVATNDLGSTTSDPAELSVEPLSVPEDARVVRLGRVNTLGANIQFEGAEDDQLGGDLSPHDPADEPPTVDSISVDAFNTMIAEAFAAGRGGVYDFAPENVEFVSGKPLEPEETGGNFGHIGTFLLDLGGGNEITALPRIREQGGNPAGYRGREALNPDFLNPNAVQFGVRLASISGDGEPASPPHRLGGGNLFVIEFAPADQVDLVGFVYINWNNFQSHRSTKPFPNKPNVRARATFTDGNESVTLISTGFTSETAEPFNTFFGFEAPEAGFHLEKIEMWGLGNNARIWAGLDDLAVRVAAVDAPSEGFADWVADSGVPADRRGPDDRNGPLDLANVQAYALGVSPMVATAADLPRTERDPADPGQVSFTYRVNTEADDLSVVIEQSADLETWAPASPVAEAVLSVDDGVETRQTSFAVDPEQPVFLRLGAELVD